MMVGLDSDLFSFGAFQIFFSFLSYLILFFDLYRCVVSRVPCGHCGWIFYSNKVAVERYFINFHDLRNEQMCRTNF